MERHRAGSQEYSVEDGGEEEEEEEAPESLVVTPRKHLPTPPPPPRRPFVPLKKNGTVSINTFLIHAEYITNAFYSQMVQK